MTNAIIRDIEPRDTQVVGDIIVSVMSSFGAVGEGYSIEDAETRAMYEAYQQPRSRYFVCERDGVVVGGGGVAPLLNGDESICELKKMYFLPEARGLGLGRAVLERSLDAARDFGFKQCYLETLTHMTDAVRLYTAAGFKPVCSPLGNTGHHRCNGFYILDL